MNVDRHCPRNPRRPVAAALVAWLMVLVACGDGPGPGEPLRGPAGQAGPPDARAFRLWEPGEELALRAEQLRIDPGSGGSTVRLLVRLNPAAVSSGDRAVTLAAPGNGESEASSAARASRLTAKASAVASAAQGVMARSVALAAPEAVLQEQFSHAVEGFALAVPWHRAAALAAELARNPAVDGVEPDREYSVGQVAPAGRTLDPRAWGVDRVDQRKRPLDGRFRQALTGSGVNVYVLDTGINPHAEFGSRLTAGFSAINDGRGTADCHGHGTHVAGTSAGATLGVAPAARLVPVRVLNCSGSTSGSSLLAGLDWVAANGLRPGVVNLSLGGSASSTIDAAAQRLATAGFTVVVAAGNNNADACAQSPARASGVLAIAASDSTDTKASFSNWGRCVALSAPGTAIASAGHVSTTDVVTMSGTSMAAPHAAGAAALLLQGRPSMSPAQLRLQLLTQATADTVSGVAAGTTRSLLFAGEGGPVAPPLVAVSVGAVTMGTQVPSVGSWRATAEVRVVDGNGAGVLGAEVAGRFSNATQDTVCTTAANGRCTLVSGTAAWQTVTALGFAVASVTGDQLDYVGGEVRTSQVGRPAAPVASVAALTGTMMRSSPTAAQWTPQFVVSVRDEQGMSVSGATVRTEMQIHAGASVTGSKALSCLTGSTGQCALTWDGPRLDATHTGARVQVLSVARDFLAYRPGTMTAASVGRVQ